MRTLSEEIAALRRENERLRAENKELKEKLLAPPSEGFRRSLGLMPYEAWMLHQLAQCYPKIATYDRLSARSTGDDPRMVAKVTISTLRKKMRPHGITIHTERGVGVYLDEASKHAFDQLSASFVNSDRSAA